MRIAAVLILVGVLVLLTLGFPGSSPQFTISGQVISNGQFPKSIRVRIKGTGLATQADSDGRFSLPFPPEARRITAWAPGHFIAGTSASANPVQIHLSPLPKEDFPAYKWVDSTPGLGEGRCGNCHETIYSEWQRSGHAQSAVNPRFLNLYDGTNAKGNKAGWSLLDEHPTGARVCSSCHAPSLAESDPALDDIRKIAGVDKQGVHCDYCHKISGPGSGEIGLTHGKYNQPLLRPREGQIFFGPLDDVDRGEDVYSSYYRDSKYCASCHEGVIFGVHVYSTYSEWLRSPARRNGKQCQHCHMKPTGKMTNIAPRRGGITRSASTLANHHFWDGDQLKMLRDSLRLQVRVNQQQEGIEVKIGLEARNVGHRVPTGFPDRQILLLVEGLDRQRKPTRLLRGPRLPMATGPTRHGLPGKLFARVLFDEKGNAPVPFWRGIPGTTDTRLIPETPDSSHYQFETSTRWIRVRVVHRRFWEETERKKHWPSSEKVVHDRQVEIIEQK